MIPQIFEKLILIFCVSLCISARYIYVLVIMQVCSHIVKCYAVASQFESCREKIQEIPAIVKDISRILYYKVSSKDACSFTTCSFMALRTRQHIEF